jgi:hypothetical protein
LRVVRDVEKLKPLAGLFDIFTGKKEDSKRFQPPATEFSTASPNNTDDDLPPAA